MTLALPYPIDPSLPSNPSPVFSDVTAARGDHLRANNSQIWANMAYLLANMERIIRTWADSVAYDANDIVLVDYTLYMCLSGHTSTADFFADWITSGKWFAIGECPGTIKEWPSASIPAGWLNITASALQTIGNTGSGATFAGPAYYLLYRLLGGTANQWTALTKVNLPDRSGIYARGAGTHNSLTKANGDKTGGFTLLQYLIDKMFGHHHGPYSGDTGFWDRVNSAADKLVLAAGTNSASTRAETGGPITDGTNGTPNSGDETMPATVIMNYMVKY